MIDVDIRHIVCGRPTSAYTEYIAEIYMNCVYHNGGRKHICTDNT